MVTKFNISNYMCSGGIYKHKMNTHLSGGLFTHNFETYTQFRVLTRRAPKKMHLTMSSAVNNCLILLTNFSIEANSVDPEQTAPIGAV